MNAPYPYNRLVQKYALLYLRLLIFLSKILILITTTPPWVEKFSLNLNNRMKFTSLNIYRIPLK
jgi:hypothetical protein